MQEKMSNTRSDHDRAKNARQVKRSPVGNQTKGGLQNGLQNQDVYRSRLEWR